MANFSIPKVTVPKLTGSTAKKNLSNLKNIKRQAEQVERKMNK